MSVPELLRGTLEALRPPPLLSLSEWADRYFYLSPESAAEPGRWKTLPYQRGIMDAITDPMVEQITLMKSARIGYTKMIDAAVGYYMHQDPCPIMVVQPTVEDAQGYSKEEIAPMLRDCPVLTELVGESTSKVSEQTILHKAFPGGSLSMVGANSGRGFRRVSRRVVIFDEVDGYPASAGAEGDQIKLGIRRSEYYWNRKIIAGSTPLVAGVSRIEEMFLSGDQRRFHVPCPQCGHLDILVFSEDRDRGHYLSWPNGRPEEAHFVCRLNGCVIEDRHKRTMLEGGEWIAEAPFAGHASFHLWTAYSVSPNASWPQLAREFLEAKDAGPEKLKTYVNTVLGETWRERGEAPDWERLYLRREDYPIGTAPAGVDVLTAGVDVQKDRLIYEVVGWSTSKESWSVDWGTLYGDTSGEDVWRQLDELLGKTYPGADGRRWPIAMLAIDSGYNTQQVYAWARRYPLSRVIAVKGIQGSSRALLGAPSSVDIGAGGRRLQRGYRVWPVGVSVAKSELYGWLRLPRPTEGQAPPPGWCHFPEYDEEYFRQLTAEHLVARRARGGFTVLEWEMLPGRENHGLDCRVYARAAAAALGIDRMLPTPPPSTRSAPVPPEAAERFHDDAPRDSPSPRGKGWLGGRGKGWLGRRR